MLCGVMLHRGVLIFDQHIAVLLRCEHREYTLDYLDDHQCSERLSTLPYVSYNVPITQKGMPVLSSLIFRCMDSTRRWTM